MSKYRRIIKLPDDLLRPLEQLLDEKRITFEAAYTIANYMPDYLLISSKKKILRSPVKSRILRIFHSRGREDRTPINGFGDRRTTIVLFPCTPHSADKSYYSTDPLHYASRICIFSKYFSPIFFSFFDARRFLPQRVLTSSSRTLP